MPRKISDDTHGEQLATETTSHSEGAIAIAIKEAPLRRRTLIPLLPTLTAGLLLLLLAQAIIVGITKFVVMGGSAPCLVQGSIAAPLRSSSTAPQLKVQSTLRAHGESAFVMSVLPYARAAHLGTGWPTSVILAQWGLEHGWQAPDFDGYNWGNSKTITFEPHLDNGFAFAATPADGLRQYLIVANLSYYAAIAPAASSGPDAAARALGASPWDEGHYTTDNHPGDSLLKLMRQYNLYQFD